MGLGKNGYRDANQATTKVNIAVDSDGYLAPSGVVNAKFKRFSITKVAAENGLEDNTEVLGFFLGLANGRQFSDTNIMQVSWEV